MYVVNTLFNSPMPLLPFAQSGLLSNPVRIIPHGAIENPVFSKKNDRSSGLTVVFDY